MSDVKWTGGVEHWIQKGDIRLFMWEKKASPKVPHAGTIFFVHGSSMASQPTFDLRRYPFVHVGEKSLAEGSTCGHHLFCARFFHGITADL